MTNILAPSNFGFVKREQRSDGRWGFPPDVEPMIDQHYSPNVLLSFRSNINRSDGKRPTDFCRMIATLVSEGPWDIKSSLYRVKYDQSCTLSLIGLPYGCSFMNGHVSVPAWMTDKVVLDAQSDMHQINANILEDLGQLRQTGVLIADIVKLMADLFLIAHQGHAKALRRRLREIGSNVPRSIANAWLIYFYGIKPLIGTIDALVKAEKPLYRKLKVRKRVEQPVDPAGFITPAWWGIQRKGDAKVQAQCQLEAQISMSGNLRTWTDLGITGSDITDAMVTAWALAPYSFVFDWFIPVESWLRSLYWSPALVYQGGFVGKRYVANASLTDAWEHYSGSFSRQRLKVRFYQRIAYPYTVPSAVLGIRLALNSNQIISAAALIVGRA